MNPTTNIDFSQSLASSTAPHMPAPPSQSSKPKVETEAKDPIVARKVQKADREKLRRDRLNEQFLELGNTLDPERPKNDKATILTDTIQMLKDLTAEVSRLKVEYTALSEESRELMQEKNELREEKASLKTDIDNLKVQYQQTLRATFPWASVDPSVVVGPTYSYPIPVPVPSGLIPAHPFPFFGNQNPGAIPGPYSTFIPYPAHANLPNGHASIPCASSSNISIKHDLSKSAEYLTAERCDGSNDVATELELKTPGSSAQQDSSTGEKKSKQSQRKEGNVTPGSTSSGYSSSQGIQDSSSNSVGDVPRSNN